jgi:TolB-like protein/Flp pilus assembly protein TadD
VSFFDELKRRNVLRVAAAYIVAAWLVIQVVETILPAFGFGDAAVRMVTIVLAIGLIPTLIVAWVFELTPEGLKKESDVDRSRSITSRTGRKLDIVIMVVLALALSFFVFDKFVLDPVRDAELVGRAIEEINESDPDEMPRKSIAVLPFANMSGDPDQEYFSDGLAEEILNVLSRVPGLEVTSRTSSFAFKGTGLNIAQVAEQLGVHYIIEGSVRRAGNQLRIAASLVDTSNGKQIWSEQFDGEAAEVFDIQDRTASAILLALNIHLEEAEAKLSGVSGTDNVLAHDLFLKGRYYFNQRILDLAVDLFQQATEVDSSYAEAFSFLALAQTMGHGQTDIPKAQAAVNRAVALAPENPATLLAQGWVANMTFDFEQADRALRQAVERDPRNGLILHLLAAVQFDLGRYEEARKLAERATNVDPAVAIYRNKLALYCMALGLTREGLANYDKANELRVHNYTSQVIWRILAGDVSVADSLMQNERETGSDLNTFTPYLQALAFFNDGKIKEARDLYEVTQEISEESSRGLLAPLEVVTIMTIYFGEIETANRLMESMLESGNRLSELRSFLPYLKDFPIERTRFNELREQIGLPGYVSQ